MKVSTLKDLMFVKKNESKYIKRFDVCK
jgi:hypothetical protein